MPKKTYKLLRFDGGISDDADPRDIGDNQFAVLENVAVDSVGKITVLGDAVTNLSALTSDFDGVGIGIVAFKTDYDGFATGTADDGGRTYFVVENAAYIRAVDTDASEAETNIGIANLVQANMLYVNGALRIYDAVTTGTIAVPTWRGYIGAKSYGTSSATAAITAGWYTKPAGIVNAFPTYTIAAHGQTYARNAIVCNCNDGVNADVIGYGFNNESTNGADPDYDGTMSKEASDQYWGVALEFDESGDGTGSWMPESTTRYQSYVTTMYDDHTQESLPVLMTMKDVDVLKSLPEGEYDTELVGRQMPFMNDFSQTVGDNVSVKFRPVVKFNGGTGTTFCFGNGDEGSASVGNQRISGCRIYWASNIDAYGDLWQICDINFDKGMKVIGGPGMDASGYTPFAACDGARENGTANAYNTMTGFDTHDGDGDVVNMVELENPPRYIRYDVINMHTKDDVIEVQAAKTAVSVNNRVYLGNVKQDGEIHGDRMLKSGVKQFDKFPRDANKIDVATHDGDDIVVMVDFADRVLQFKKNTLYIINVSDNSEFLESENKHKGVTNPGAVCRTDYGVAWINNFGCYLYDGKQVVNLLESKGTRFISNANWTTHIGTNNGHRIGFNPLKRQLVVLSGDDSSGAGYLYDMTTQSWQKGTAVVADANTKSPFFNNPDDGTLLIINQGTNYIQKWQDGGYSGQGDYTINITTKDIDFGEPAVRKKIYKVYITYKVNDTTVPAVYYDTEGNTTLTNEATAVTAFANTSGQWTKAEYKFDSDANSAYSMQLKISGAVDRTFEINDITFIYRIKTVK